jgi:exodeoxyribonuclease V alpha subunit
MNGLALDLQFFDGIGPQLAQRIQQRWPIQQDLEQMLRERPYDLTRIRGVGFTRADRIALQCGMKPNSRDRRRAATLYVVKRAEDNGHTSLSADDVIVQVAEFGLEPDVEHPDLVTEDEFISYAPNYRAEQYISQRLIDMVKPVAWSNPIITGELASDQLEALELILEQMLFVLLGAAGTGKTTLLKTLLRNLKNARQSFALAAPTGKAAKRIEELTGQNARTIHRLLEATYDESRGRFLFKRNEKNPLDADWIIIDEASMVDVQLMQSLLRAIPASARLLLVGDPWQLPSGCNAQKMINFAA